jgi:hypothetical protein
MTFVPYVFTPAYAFISDITLGVQTTVTFTQNHDFTPGEIVSFRVTPVNGTRELNNMETTVQSITPTTITVDINSTFFTPFISNIYVQVPPVCVPSATGIIPGDPLNTTNLADAFDNMAVT